MPPATHKNGLRRVLGDRGSGPASNHEPAAGGARIDALFWLLFTWFLLAAVAVIQWRGAPHPVLVGQRLSWPVVSRTDFQFVDAGQTERLREEARQKAPSVYVEHLDGIRILEDRVKDLYDNPSMEIHLNRWLGIKPDEGRKKDEALRACIRTLSPEEYASAVSNLFQMLRRRGVFSGADYERERARGIRVIRAGGGVVDRLTDPLSPGYPRAILACLQEEGTFNSVPRECRDLLKDLLVHELEPTLTWDEAKSRRAKKDAEQAVAIVIGEHRAGDILLATDTVVRREHIDLLRKEAMDYYATLMPHEFALRLAGVSILVLIMGLLFLAYLRQFHPKLIESRAEMLKLGALSLIALALAKAIIYLGPSLPLAPHLIPAYLIPLPFIASLAAIVYSPRMARIISFFLAILVAVMAGNNFALLVVLFLSSLVAINVSTPIRERSKPMKIGILSGLTQTLASIGLSLLVSQQPWEWWPAFLSGLLNGIETGVALTVLLPFVERVFRVVTDLTLLELSDQNHPLLRRLAIEAPGTYQHTLMVATLAEAGAEACGANSLLARVGSYYHDIGKLAKPHYFVENEDWRGSQHRKLNVSMSTLIITAHTRDGIALAREYRLPKAIIDFIPEHHGTARIEYFYQQALKERGADENVDDSLYRYPGPKPQSPETAIVLLADTCEAACRTLENPNPSRIQALVHELILSRLLDGQLDECSLSLNDLRRIEENFVRSLISFYHSRIKYPSRDTSEHEHAS